MRTNETIKTVGGSLVQAFDSIQRVDGSLVREWVWWFIPRGLGERRAVGVVSEMSAAEALRMVE